MQINVQIICFCYISRFGYDIIKLLIMDKFRTWREDQAAIDGWQYPLFLFCFMMLVEFLPIVMFSFNLKYVFNNHVALSPKFKLLNSTQTNPFAQTQVFSGSGSGVADNDPRAGSAVQFEY